MEKTTIKVYNLQGRNAVALRIWHKRRNLIITKPRYSKKFQLYFIKKQSLALAVIKMTGKAGGVNRLLSDCLDAASATVTLKGLMRKNLNCINECADRIIQHISTYPSPHNTTKYELLVLRYWKKTRESQFACSAYTTPSPNSNTRYVLLRIKTGKLRPYSEDDNYQIVGCTIVTC